MTRERLMPVILLASIFLHRAIHLDQPIVENYVGRQIPTAMVARNLERGSGFLHPQLDTGPFPNLFLVEPPIYAQLVASFRSTSGIALEPSGRLISAIAVVLAGWGLYGLIRRREGSAVALVGLASFGLFPVMIRFGRDFQPDALMLGCVLAGLRSWDEYENSGDRRWAALGGFVLAVGLALKITVIWALIPFLLIVGRWKLSTRILAAIAMLIPAAAWYLYVWKEVVAPAGGSLAHSESTGIWLNLLFSTRVWLRFITYDSLIRGLCYRGFTPIGFVLAAYGLAASGKLDRLWVGWIVGCGLSIVGLAAKWHHVYYWMVVAPVMAVGVGRGLVKLASLAKFGRSAALGLGSFFLVVCLVQSASTFETPVEWQGLNEAIPIIKRANPLESMIVAPEAVLYYADLKGYRLEFGPEAKQRAAGEWRVRLSRPDEPLSLVEFYREAQSIGFLDESKPVELQGRPLVIDTRRLLVADVGSIADEPRRAAWREAIRRRPKTTILADEPGYLIAELN